MWQSVLLLFLTAFLKVETTTPCRKLKVPEETSHVCVCSDRYCDEFDQPPESYVRDGTYVYYSSTNAGERLKVHTGKIQSTIPRISRNTAVVMRVDSSRRYQEIHGFGGAMTDAAGLNIAKLSKPTQETLLKQYFGRTGIGYSFIRIPFAGTDFSTYNYTYDDSINDFNLRYFALKYEDYNYKIPYVKMAQQISPVPIKLFSSSWSAPEWMKELRVFENGSTSEGYSRLQNRFYKLYSDYYIRCLDEYKKNGLEFWAISPQNEPFHGLENYYHFNSMGWTPEEQRDWIGNVFGPALHSRGYRNVKLLILDDNRTFLPGWALTVMADQKVRDYVSGIGIHWYFDYLDPNGERLTQTHVAFPDKFLLYTESSVIPFNTIAVRLGNWERAENYTSNIIEDINHWVTGWVDWNMALDTTGGPNWAGNTVESPIIINTTANVFYKQPLFYALAHFSKFVPPGSRRIAYRISSLLVECVAFLRPDNIVAIVLQNRGNVDLNVVVLLEGRKNILVPAERHSIHTVLYKPAVPREGYGNERPVWGS